MGIEESEGDTVRQNVLGALMGPNTVLARYWGINGETHQPLLADK